MSRPVWYPYLPPSSVEHKVAKALADKEGIALKRRIAIEEEAERKRMKKEAAEKAKIKVFGTSAKSPEIQTRPTTAAPIDVEEEKYAGPLLNGSAPEMIVSSGALGITNTKRKVQVNYQTPRKRVAEGDEFDDEMDYDDIDYDGPSTSTRPPKLRMTSTAPIQGNKVLTVKDYLQGGFELTPEIAPLLHASQSAPTQQEPTSSNLKIPTSAVEKTEPMDALDETIFNVVEKALHGGEDDYDKFVMYKPKNRVAERSIAYDDPVEQEGEVTPEPQESLEERIERERQEKERLRFKEIGRRICELELSDFAAPKSRNDRRSFMIATRGEEILACVRRNLGIIRDKLGEYSERTIFENVDKLTDSFAAITPNELSRLNKLVEKKLKQRADALLAEQTLAAALRREEESTDTGMMDELKLEEPEVTEVKTEPPEYQE